MKEERSEETNRPPKEHKTDLEFHYKNYPETLKTLKEIYENKWLKISLSNTIIVDNVDTGIDIKTLLHSIKLKNAPVDPNYFLILKVLNLRPHLVKNNILRTQNGSDWFNYSSDRIKLQKLYNERGPAAFGFINNFTKASGISRERVTEFLQSKDS